MCYWKLSIFSVILAQHNRKILTQSISLKGIIMSYTFDGNFQTTDYFSLNLIWMSPACFGPTRPQGLPLLGLHDIAQAQVYQAAVYQPFKTLCLSGYWILWNSVYMLAPLPAFLPLLTECSQDWHLLLCSQKSFSSGLKKCLHSSSSAPARDQELVYINGEWVRTVR